MTGFMEPIGSCGQARRAARCSASGKRRNAPERANGLHRRPLSSARPPRCGPLVVRCTTARTAPNGRAEESGETGHYLPPLVLGSP